MWYQLNNLKVRCGTFSNSKLEKYYPLPLLVSLWRKYSIFYPFWFQLIHCVATSVLSLISVILRSHKIWKQFWVALSKLYQNPLWDMLKSKMSPLFVLYLNTVIWSLNSILRFLVYWLGHWPVTQVSPVQIPPKSLVTYIFTEIFEKGTFLVRRNPKPVLT